MIWFLTSTVATLFIAILTPFGKRNWAESDLTGKSIYIITVIGLLATDVFQIKDYRKNVLLEKVAAKIGSFAGYSETGYLKLSFGPNDLCAMSWAEAETKEVFGPFMYRMINIYRKNNKLCVYAIVRDKTGNPIAVINENEWTLLSDDYEYNNDEHGFELVTKGERKVYFQVYIKNDIVHMLGILLCETGDGLKFVGCQYPWNGMVKLSTEKPYLFTGIDGAAIFKYPRGTHLGERIN